MMTYPGAFRLLHPAFIAYFIGALLLGLAGSANSKEPGRGKTGPFEVKYLKFIIDHHYSALPPFKSSLLNGSASLIRSALRLQSWDHG